MFFYKIIFPAIIMINNYSSGFQLFTALSSPVWAINHLPYPNIAYVIVLYGISEQWRAKSPLYSRIHLYPFCGCLLLKASDEFGVLLGGVDAHGIVFDFGDGDDQTVFQGPQLLEFFGLFQRRRGHPAQPH